MPAAVAGGLRMRLSGATEGVSGGSRPIGVRSWACSTHSEELLLAGSLSIGDDRVVEGESFRGGARGSREVRGIANSPRRAYIVAECPCTRNGQASVTDDPKLREADDAVEAALLNNPGIHQLDPERGFHACFEVPVTLREVLAHGIPVDHLPAAGEAGDPERLDAGGDFRVFVAVTLRREPDGKLGVATGVDLEFLARLPASPDPEWLSATRIRDPDGGEWVQTAAPAAVQQLLHDTCPGWSEVVRAEVVRLAVMRQGKP